VGESLKKETIELLTLIYRANTRYQKADVLQMAREQIEVIRLLITLFLGPGSYFCSIVKLL